LIRLAAGRTHPLEDENQIAAHKTRATSHMLAIVTCLLLPLFATCVDAFLIFKSLFDDCKLRSNSNRPELSMSTEAPKRVAIAGAGIIGTSTAYFLAKNYNISSILIDVTGKIAPAASGKAGGFLALDWNDDAPTGPLTRRSFELHQELADSFGTETIQYRRLTSAAISLSGQKPKSAKLHNIEWASAGTTVQSLGDERTIAQVHPRLLAEALWKNTPRGTLMKGQVIGESTDKDGMFIGAKLADGTIVDADALVYCCGPWSANVLFGVKYHSVVVPTKRVLSQCVFFQGNGDPEVYVRPDQTAYCTAFPDPAQTVTEVPGQEEVLSDRIQTILNAVKASGGSDDLIMDDDNLLIQQSCYLPTTEDGKPVIGHVGDKQNVYIAAGHSCWGILLGPATGESMASLIATGRTSINLGEFKPQRYPHMVMVPNNCATKSNVL
jgi:glycine/D-amino acid oxidase-like deaminating enzyme